MLLLFSLSTLNGQIIQVFDHQKISNTEGGFTGSIPSEAYFGHGVCVLGDLDDDGVEDLAVGAFHDNDGGTDIGSLWILFLNEDGTVKSEHKINDSSLDGKLHSEDNFGRGIAALGDLDGDGVEDIAVGADGDNDGGSGGDPKVGAVWILFLNTDGTVKDYQKISNTQGDFTGILGDTDYFGIAIDSLGDLDGDDVVDIAVGARFDNDGGYRRGAVWILFLNSDGTVKDYQKISDTAGGFGGLLYDDYNFGNSLGSLGDLDGDGVTDIAVGGSRDNDGGTFRGAVWILFLNADGTVKSQQKISDTQGGFDGVLDDVDRFGCSFSSADFDDDGLSDLVVGAIGDDDGGNYLGAVWLLYLNSDGTVKSHSKISSTEGNFQGVLDAGDWFGVNSAIFSDLNNDGFMDVAVGARRDDDGATDSGAVWILFLESLGLVDVEITGPDEVAENWHGQYQAIAHFEDESTLDITDIVDWSVEPNDIASIDSNGLMETSGINRIEEIVTVIAEYIAGDDIVASAKDVTIFAVCPPGIALEFDGENDYVKLSENVITTTEFTFMAWANHYGPSGGITNNNPIFSQRDDTTGDSHSTIGLRTESSDGSFSEAGIRSNTGSVQGLKHPKKNYNEWHHYAMTVDSNDFIFYIDGVEVDKTTNNQTGNYITSIDYVYFGRHRYNGKDHGYFNGAIDDVRAYDRALTEEEIRDTMHIRLNGDEPGLVAYWDFDEGEGQVAYDSTINANDGQLGSTPEEDDNDPAWVFFACTPYEFALRGINRALDKKYDILELLEMAIQEETGAIEAMDMMQESGEYEVLKKQDVQQARIETEQAVQQEEVGKDKIEEGAEKLEESLLLLNNQDE